MATERREPRTARAQEFIANLVGRYGQSAIDPVSHELTLADLAAIETEAADAARAVRPGAGLLVYVRALAEDCRTSGEASAARIVDGLGDMIEGAALSRLPAEPGLRAAWDAADEATGGSPWSVSVRRRSTGRWEAWAQNLADKSDWPVIRIGEGPSEIAALTDLADRLRAALAPATPEAE